MLSRGNQHRAHLIREEGSTAHLSDRWAHSMRVTTIRLGMSAGQGRGCQEAARHTGLEPGGRGEEVWQDKRLWSDQRVDSGGH